MNLSVIVLFKDEIKSIIPTLQSITWADEIILIMDCTNKPDLSFLKKLTFPIKVFERKLNSDYSAQRNFGLSKASNRWILYIDSDEVIDNNLKIEIEEILKKEAKSKIDYNGFYIKREDFIFGKYLKHGETSVVKLLRLARKDCGIWKGKVHEVWDIKGQKGELVNPLKHYPHQTVSAFLKSIDYYTDILSIERYKKGISVNVFQIFFIPIFKFIYIYFVLFGFLDGMPGLITAVLMSMHSYLVRSKLWLLSNTYV